MYSHQVLSVFMYFNCSISKVNKIVNLLKIAKRVFIRCDLQEKDRVLNKEK